MDTRRSGQRRLRASRHRSSGSVTSMMTAGSIRGKCSLPSAGQRWACPAATVTVGVPQRGQCVWVACQLARATACVSRPASRSFSSAAASRRSAARSPGLARASQAACSVTVCCSGRLGPVRSAASRGRLLQARLPPARPPPNSSGPPPRPVLGWCLRYLGRGASAAPPLGTGRLASSGAARDPRNPVVPSRRSRPPPRRPPRAGTSVPRAPRRGAPAPARPPCRRTGPAPARCPGPAPGSAGSAQAAASQSVSPRRALTRSTAPRASTKPPSSAA